MQRLVDNIAEVAEVSADDAFALCCALLYTEGHVHGQVDDSSGRISHVYRGTLLGLVRSIVHRCRDEKRLLAALLQACSHDELGTQC